MANSISDSGGYEGSNQNLKITPGGGKGEYNFEFYSIPDRFIVRYEGRTLLDTGFVSGSRTGTFTIPDGQSDQIQVIVATDNAGTAWTYTVTAEGCWPTDPLAVTPTGGQTWGDADNDGNCDLTGTVLVGYGGGDLLRVEGATVELEKDKVTFKGGKAYALIGNLSEPLIDGSFDLQYKNGLSSTVDTDSTLVDNIPIKVKAIQLQQNEIGVGFNYTLPDPFDNVELVQPIPLDISSIRLTSEGIRFGKPGFIQLPDIKGVELFPTFKIFTADFTDGRISSDPLGTELKLQGKITTKSPVKGTKIDTVEIDLAGDNYISISAPSKGATPDVDVKGKLTVGANWEIAKGWSFQGLTLGIDTIKDEVTAGGGLRIPLGVRLDLDVKTEFNFTYNPWELNGVKIDLSLQGGGIPIPGLPSLFLTRVAGGVNNLKPKEPAPVEYSGGLGFSVLPKTEFFHLMSFDLDGTLKEGESLTGSVKGRFAEFGGEALGQLDGSATYDYAKGAISGSIALKLLDPDNDPATPGAFSGQASFAGSKKGFDFYGQGDGQIPPKFTFRGTDYDIPGIGGKKLANANFKATYSHDGNLSNDFAAAWGKATLELFKFGTRDYSYDLTAGVKVYFDGDVEFIGNKNVPPASASPVAAAAPVVLAFGAIANDAVNNAGAQTLAAAAAATERFDVEAGAALLILTAQWQNAAAGPVPLSVTLPDGQVVQEADFAAAGIYTVPELDTPTSRSVAVLNPGAGRWGLAVDDPTGLGTVTTSALLDTPDPTVTVAAPVADASGGWAFDWTAANLPPDAVLNFYADSDAAGFDGFMIASGVDASAGSGSFVWDGDGVAPGSYTVYAVLDGEGAVPALAYAPAAVSVNRTADLSVKLSTAASAISTDAADAVLNLEVANQGAAGAANTQVLIELPPGFALQPGQAGIVEEGTSIRVDLGTIAKGGTATKQITVNRSGTLEPGTAHFNASVFSDTHEADPDDNGITLSVPLVAPAPAGYDLTIGRDGLDQTVAQGGTLTYTVTLGNQGTDPAATFALAETVSGGQVVGARIKSSNAGSANVSFGTNQAHISGSDFAPGDEVVVEIDVEVFGTAAVVARSNLDGDPGSTELYPADNDTIDYVGTGAPGAVQDADLSLALAASSLSVDVDETVTFTLDLTNAGPGPASGIVVDLPLSGRFEVTNWSAIQGTYDAATGKWDVGNMRDGLTRTLTVTATAKSPGTDPVTAEIAAVAEGDPDSTPNNHDPAEDDQASVALSIRGGEPPPLTHHHDALWDHVDLASGDLNGDGKAEIIGYYDDSGLSYYDPSTGLWTTLHEGGLGSIELAAGDITGDGRDEIIGYYDTWGLGWYDTTTGSWTRLHDGGWGTVSLASGDLNGDGRDEIIGYYENSGLGYYDHVTGLWTGIHGTGWEDVPLAAGDINADGRDEVIGYYDTWGFGAHDTTTWGLGWYDTTTGTWTKLHDGGWGTVSLASGDLNGDGRDEIVGYYENSGLGYYDHATGLWTGVHGTGWSDVDLAVGDIDGSGRAEIIGYYDDWGLGYLIR